MGRRGPVISRGAPKFGLDRTSAEYSAEGFGSVRFGHASTLSRTSVLFGLSFVLQSAHLLPASRVHTPRISVFRRYNKLTFTCTEPSRSHKPKPYLADVRSKPNFSAPLMHMCWMLMHSNYYKQYTMLIVNYHSESLWQFNK